MQVNINLLHQSYKKSKTKTYGVKKYIKNKRFQKFPGDRLNQNGLFFSDKGKAVQTFAAIETALNSNSYTFKPFTCILLPKKNKPQKARPISIPSPEDRIVFTYMLKILEKDLLPKIQAYNVFGAGKNQRYPKMLDILKAVSDDLSKYAYVLKVDIESFFPSVNRVVLLEKIKKEIINNQAIIQMIEKVFENPFKLIVAGNFDQDDVKKIETQLKGGIPQGTAFSPLLANFYALDLDEFIKQKGYISYRYLDDMIIFFQSIDDAKKVFDELKEFSKKTLDLSLHNISSMKEGKTYIADTSGGVEYLGMTVKKGQSFRIPKSKILKEKEMIMTEMFNYEVFDTFRNVPLIIEITKRHVDGWKNYYRKNFSKTYAEQQQYEIKSANKTLKNHYSFILNNKRKNKTDMKKILSEAGFDIKNDNFYL